MRWPPYVNNLFNDVRKHGSAPLSWFGTAALLVATAGRRREPLTYVKVGIFVSPPDGGRANYFYLANGRQQGFVWSTGVVPFGAKIVWAYVHTHPMWVSEQRYYFDMNASALGLDMPAYRHAHNSVVYDVNHEKARADLDLPSKPAMQCQSLRAAAAYDSVREVGGDVFGGRYYRRDSGCRPFQLWKGQRWVAIAFLAPDSPSVETASIAIHTELRLLVSSHENDRPGFESPYDRDASGDIVYPEQLHDCEGYGCSKLRLDRMARKGPGGKTGS